MEKVPLCVVGCGGMGHRHIMAYKVLEESGRRQCRIDSRPAMCAGRVPSSPPPRSAAAVRARAHNLYGYGFDAQAR